MLYSFKPLNKCKIAVALSGAPLLLSLLCNTNTDPGTGFFRSVARNRLVGWSDTVSHVNAGGLEGSEITQKAEV